ncbi:MAG TPA: class I SAM-dependent methyltransferase [Sphingomicrobium sp.]|nr:class I SAM-dependent methyltransferase [Sphingomicrobium sp.]
MAFEKGMALLLAQERATCNSAAQMTGALDWAAASGDSWAARWRALDLALGNLSQHLIRTIFDRASVGDIRALDIGCGAGATTLAVADTPRFNIIGCDLSPALIAIATERAEGRPNVRFCLGDACSVASSEAPFDLLFSRHGVMFFADPVAAFSNLLAAARPGASLVFSCFADWSRNAWASRVAEAAAGHGLEPPDKSPSGFAFADPAYVGAILTDAGWAGLEHQFVEFRYSAGSGEGAVDDALELLAHVGPASAQLRDLDEGARPAAKMRMRRIIEAHRNDRVVDFPAAAWIWSARAAGESR